MDTAAVGGLKLRKKVKEMHKNTRLYLTAKWVGLISLIIYIVLAVTVGCSKTEDDVKKPSVVAQIGNSAITIADFKGYLSERPLPKQGRISEEDVVKRLDEMALEEVLYKEAIRLKLDQDPKVRMNIRQILSQKLIRDQVIQKFKNMEVTEKELKEYYDQHWYEYNRPEQVRLADIFIAVSPGDSDDKKAEMKKKAETVLTEALKTKGNRMAFSQLIREHSDTHSKYQKGDTGFFDIEGNPVGIDIALAKTAFEIEKNGSICDHVIPTPDGYHIIMRIGKRSAVHRSFDTVRNQIKQRIRLENYQTKRLDYVDTLKKNANIQINDTVVAEIVKELRKP